MFRIEAFIALVFTALVVVMLALSAALALFATPVEAQVLPRNCAPREVVIARLAEGYGEVRQAVGLGANSSLMEVFASPEGGSWTITVTTPTGLTCLVASGQSYEALPLQSRAPGDDT